MLQTMRHLAQSWLFKGLMLILVISFGIWGVGDIFRGNPMQRRVAKVGSESITVQDLNHAFEEELAKARQRLGPDITAQRAKQSGLLDTTLDELIIRTELEQAIRGLGLDVSDKAAFDWIASQPGFRNKDGSINRDMFQRAMERAHMDEPHFIVEAKKSISGQQLLGVLGTAGKPPQSIVGPLTAALGQKRILDVVTLMNNSIRDIPPPDENILRDFYQKNAKLFTAPEYRAMTVARLSTDDMAKDITVTDDQLKKEYDAHSAQFAHPERRDVLQVVVQDEAKAKQLSVAARASGNLASAAENMGSKTVPLNGTEEKSLLPELSKPLFALSPGQVADPIKSPLGWHVVQLKKIAPPGTPEFKDVKDQLLDTMRRDQAIDAATRTVNQLDDELAAGHALEDIADSLKLRLIKIPALTAQGKTPDGKDPAELPSKADVLKAAFGQGAGESSPVMDDKNGNYVVVRTDEVTPSAVRPFEQVKDQIAAAWKTKEQERRAAAQAEVIAKALRDGKAPSSFAAQDGVEVRVSKPISLLGDKDSSLPDSVLPQVTKMKKGEVITSSEPDRQIVLRLAEVVDADNAPDSPGRTKVASALNRELSDDLSEEYLKYLRVLFPVEVNQDLLDTLRQDGS